MHSGFMFGVRPANFIAKQTGQGVHTRRHQGCRESGSDNVHGQRRHVSLQHIVLRDQVIQYYFSFIINVR